jgi:hypothetical protein
MCFIVGPNRDLLDCPIRFRGGAADRGGDKCISGLADYGAISTRRSQVAYATHLGERLG